VDAILAATDVLVVPSRQEAFGNVVLEACAAGVPVVTSRRVGAAEVLDGEVASLVVDDPERLADLRSAIDRALDPTRHGGLSRAARALAERHPWSTHIDEVERVLGEVARA
jgi:UDP-glucose:(heptosyl)LPS alpha-1,3-glucosyltransferase